MKRSPSSLFALVIVVANLAAVLLVVNGAIVRKQAIVDEGRAVFLELAPVDPRSLMQGEYMRLNYALNRDDLLRGQRGAAPTRGRMILQLDERKVATFHALEDGEVSESRDREIAL